MENQTRDEIKSVRSEELIELGEKMRRTYLESFAGAEKDVLIEEQQEAHGELYLTGHTKEYVRVLVKGDVKLINNIVTVKIRNEIKNQILLADIQEM